MLEIEIIQETTCCYIQPNEHTISYISRVDKIITEDMWKRLDIRTQLWYNNNIRTALQSGEY